MTDIVERLRKATLCVATGERMDAGQFATLTIEEADEARKEIERLRAQVIEESDFWISQWAFRVQAIEEWQALNPDFRRSWPDGTVLLHWLLDRHKADQEEIERLREALQALLDEQNGPPLIRNAASWQAACDAARAALKETEHD